MLTPDQLSAFAKGIAELGFWSGVLGAVFWKTVCDIWALWCDKYLEWEQRRSRIVEARMRFQHGPALYPALPAAARRAVIRIKQRQARHG